MNKKINKKMISLVLTFMLITSLFSGSVLAEIALMADGAPTASAIKASDMPNIDGDLTAEEGWNINTPITKADGEGNNSAKFGTMWDDLYLYVGVDITDDTVVSNGLWAGDDVEIYLDGLNNKSTTYLVDDMQIGFPYTPEGTEQPVGFGGSTSTVGRDASDILRSCKKTATGWSEEIAIPWSMLNFEPGTEMKDKTIGFDVLVSDGDKVQAGLYESGLLWSGINPDGSTPGWNNTSVFGNLNLSDKAPADVKVTGVTLDKNTLEVEAGQAAQLKATVAPQDATNKAVKWTSNDETVATVDANGNVKAIKEGNAVITVATVDGDFKANCNVTVKKSAPIVTKGSIIEVTTSADFGKGTLEGAKITNNRNGEVELNKVNGSYVNKGVFTSDVINTAPFSQLIATWNTDTPEGTSVDIEAQALVDGVWSDWISWGNWSTSKERASVDDSDATKLAGIWTDTLYIKNDKTANAVRFRVTLNSSDPNATPVLRAINGSIDLNHGAKMYYPEGEDKAAIEAVDKVLDVPAFSQMVRDPKIADSICSPTSATNVVDYYLAKSNIPGVLPEESAWSVYDTTYDGFGNWAFSASYMGSFGLTTKVVQCSSIYDLKREIYNGRPVVISVSNARNENNNDPDVANFPIIHGFPIPATWGHLITVTGFTKVDGKEYVCVNDSAAANDDGVKLKYLLDEFDTAWATSGRIAYFADDSDGAAYNPLKRLPAKEFVTGITESREGKEYAEIQLKYNGSAIDLSQANAKTIMVSKDGGAYEYIAPDAKNSLWFAKDKPEGTYNVLVIAKDNKEYTVNFAWPQTGENPDLQEGDLVLKATASELSTLIGKEVTIKISVDNTLGVPLRNIKVEHQIPEGIAYVSDDSNGAYDSKTGVWTIGEIDAKGTVELNIKVKATMHGQIDNMVSIYVDTLEDPIEDCATFIVENAAPEVGNYSVTTDKNKAVTGKVVATDADKDELTYSLNNSHSGSTVVVNPDGTWTYTPGQNYYGDDSFTVKVKDAFGGEAVSTITVKINNANTAPTAKDYKVSTDQNVALEGKIVATDAEEDVLTYSIATAPLHGKVDVKADGSWVYTPGKDYAGEDKFAVKVDDGQGGVATSNVEITVKAKTPDPDPDPDPDPQPGKKVERIAGADRYETSVEISSKGWKTSEYIILANGLNYADSLCAAPLAKKYNAPILLTDPSNLSDAVKKEIQRLGVKHVFVVGGDKVVTNKVVDVLKNTLKIEDVKRIGGKDRYETSALIAKEIGDSAKFVVVSGQSYADALSIASIAGVKGAPILLTDGNNLPKSIAEIIKANKVTDMFIIGGDKVVSAAVEKQIKALANVDVKRLAGANRYDTNIAVVKEFGNDENVKSDNLFIATGNGFADALSVSALIAKDKGVLILTDKTLQPTTEKYLKDTVNANSNVFVAGGEKVVSSDIIKSIDKLIGAAK